MAIHPDAGKPVSKENLTDIAELISLYYETQPDVSNPERWSTLPPISTYTKLILNNDAEMINVTAINLG